MNNTMRVLLVDRTPAMVRAWRQVFVGGLGGEAPDDVEDVEIYEDDYFARDADAMVSPANSFGIMDGGLDLAIRDQLGLPTQRRLQQAIVERHHGELPVGCAEIVATEHARWPWLVAAPTMRVPENVAATLNAYLAFRAVLLACARHESPIRSIVCCGLATGIGGMEPIRCAKQMRIAHKHATGPARIPSFDTIHAVHAALRTS
jgi:O-acetyl-ADP-ribose deacetylase (regulator of RNase III)